MLKITFPFLIIERAIKPSECTVTRESEKKNVECLSSFTHVLDCPESDYMYIVV